MSQNLNSERNKTMKIGDHVTWAQISKPNSKTISMKQRKGHIVKMTPVLARVQPTTKAKSVLVPLVDLQLVGQGKTQLTRFVETVVGRKAEVAE